MRKIKLTKNSQEISIFGLGCMGMSEFYGPSDEKESIKTIIHALDNGITMLDTADTYGIGDNERLVSKAIKEWNGKRDDVFIATKFGIQREKGHYERSINGRPEYVHKACDESLKRLDVDYIDLYYQHRIDPNVPIVETVGAMSELVKKGKVKYIGLSEASANSIKKAHEEHPITALQSEYSLWTRDLEEEILPTLQDLDIALVAYSPLGRGFLTGAIKDKKDLDKTDFRHFLPRFQEENFNENNKSLTLLENFAKEKQATPAQIALAWIIKQKGTIIPVFGTRKVSRLKENMAAAEIDFSESEISLLNQWFAPGSASGERYPEEGMKGVNL